MLYLLSPLGLDSSHQIFLLRAEFRLGGVIEVGPQQAWAVSSLGFHLETNNFMQMDSAKYLLLYLCLFTTCPKMEYGT